MGTGEVTRYISKYGTKRCAKPCSSARWDPYYEDARQS